MTCQKLSPPGGGIITLVRGDNLIQVHIACEVLATSRQLHTCLYIYIITGMKTWMQKRQPKTRRVYRTALSTADIASLLGISKGQVQHMFEAEQLLPGTSIEALRCLFTELVKRDKLW